MRLLGIVFIGIGVSYCLGGCGSGNEGSGASESAGSGTGGAGTSTATSGPSASSSGTGSSASVGSSGSTSSTGASSTSGTGSSGSTSGAGGSGGGSPYTETCDQPNARHISPSGAGSGDGTSEANAGTMADLDAFIQAVGPGGEVCIHAGTYGTGYVVSAGGAPGAPVVIKGVGGLPLFKSNFDASTGAKSGPVAIRIEANHLVFHNFEFQNVGDCFRFPASSNVDAVTLSRFRAVNLATCVNVERYGTQSVTNLTITRAMILQFTRGGIFFGGATDGAKVEDSYIDMQPAQIGGQGSDYAVGIAFYDATKNVQVIGTTVLNVYGTPVGYSQGDGIDGEPTAGDITVTGSFFAGCRDGCIDTKARNFLIENTIGVGCKRNFRLWQDNYPNGPRCEGCVSYQPTGDAHFFVDGNIGTANNITVYSDNSADLVATDNGGSLSVNGISGTLASPANLNTASIMNSSVVFGQSFQIPPTPNPTPFSP